jgi:hypothetical protein
MFCCRIEVYKRITCRKQSKNGCHSFVSAYNVLSLASDLHRNMEVIKMYGLFGNNNVWWWIIIIIVILFGCSFNDTRGYDCK